MSPPVNTRRVIVERHHGWEGASPALLARVFNISVQRATAICQERCAACGKPICGCTDDQWSGPSNAPPSPLTGDRDGVGNARAASRDVNAGMARGSFWPAKLGNVATSQVSA